MWPYWLLFLLPAWMAVSCPPIRGIHAKNRWSSVWWLALLGVWLMMGLRHQVGGDWSHYDDHILQAASLPFFEAITLKLNSSDPGFSILLWLSSKWGSIYLIDAMAAAIFCWGLAIFCRSQPRPWLALLVAVPYLIMVVGMGYLRQGIAVGFELLGLVALENRRIKKFIVLIIAGASFHKTALILLPLSFLFGSRRRLVSGLMAVLVGVVFYRLLLADSLNRLIANYIGDGYQSNGAGLRIAMDALPATLFLWYRRRFMLTATQNTLWTWLSVAAWLGVAAFFVSPSSTAVDRIALYLIPLQLFVWSRLPDVFTKRGYRQAVVYLVVSYSFVVHFIWLNYADHSHYWIPYQFYPWFWLWE